MAKQKGAVPYAGGTDFMIRHAKALQTGQCPPFIFLNDLNELQGISNPDNTVRIGALATMAALSVNKEIPGLLSQACNCVGSPALRSAATLGGNICTASPAGDSLPPLYALGAQVEICSPAGRRLMPIRDFISGPGTTTLQSDELLSAVILPVNEFNEFYHHKVSPRVANAITKVSLAVAARIENKRIKKIRMAFGSVGPTIICCPQIEAACTGSSLSELLSAVPELKIMVEKTIKPIDDHRSTAQYRRSIAANLLADCIETFGNP